MMFHYLVILDILQVSVEQVDDRFTHEEYDNYWGILRDSTLYWW